VQPEIESPSVRQTVAALERLMISETLRDEGLVEHTYPLRDQDLETVYAFAEAYGELPPIGYWRSLWWHLRS
jgi:hypothetical protein